MIYPDTTGLPYGAIELNTLERVWIQGRLKMWGRWASYSTNPRAKGIIENLIQGKTVTRAAIQDALQRLQRAGLEKGQLFEFFQAMQKKQVFSSLVFCTDAEGLKMDRVILDTLSDSPGLKQLVIRRYCYKLTPKALADRMHDNHPELSLSTCRRRIDVWLKSAEIILYAPMFAAFERNRLHR
ncbi:DUF1133 family protein [Pantoea coffeiphila]|uniref:ATP-dependent Zn protease n=1 Tax=Pantoea coffeiphila TaxID=1465635 RepID=A0A2S9I877_9GAMM|nr:DUF1133 family protein [Pantoea coffeiphila]PRD13998.1 ATP-dependent Zn protease [Pantoea coffeiphila]